MLPRHDQLRVAGQPLDGDTRAFFEPRLSADLGGVRLHTDVQARRLADNISARAFTHGADVWLGSGERADDRALLAHELVHTVQQGGVVPYGTRREPAGRRAAIQRQERKAEGVGLNVVVVGAPGPHEVEASHPYQFANAAFELGDVPNSIWFVEQTGYAHGKVDPRLIERMAPRLVWITPENKLVDQLNALGPHSIASLRVFSHGLPGFVTLRYGWDEQGLPNYGFGLQDVTSLREDLFVPNATVRFDSCNTGTSDWYSPEGSLAQAFAQRTGQTVKAWTGRTSYTEVNRAAGSRPADVKGSEMVSGHSVDWREVGSRYLGRDPELRTFSPATGPRVGGFTSTFSMRLRIPESRKFDVPKDGVVVVTCSDVDIVDPADDTPIEPDPKRVGSTNVEISLIRNVDWGADRDQGVRSFPLGSSRHAEMWSGLAPGQYYLEIWRDGNSNFLTNADIAVDVHAP